MGAAVILIGVIALLVYATAGPFKRGSLSTFEPKVGPIVHSFRGEPDAVLDALMHGVAQTPGATLVEFDSDSLLLSTRRTPTQLHGYVGLLVRMRLFSPGEGITTVVVEAQPKVASMSSTRAMASMVQFERDVRMAAKRLATVEELVAY